MANDLLRRDSRPVTLTAKPTVKSSTNPIRGAAQPQATKPKASPEMSFAKSAASKVPNPGNPHVSKIPKFDLGKTIATKTSSPKSAPKPKPMNDFVNEVYKILGGQASSKTPLTKQHGERLIATRHGLPPYASDRQKQDIYDVEAKIFDLLNPPISNHHRQGVIAADPTPKPTINDLYKAIGVATNNDVTLQNADIFHDGANNDHISGGQGDDQIESDGSDQVESYHFGSEENFKDGKKIKQRTTGILEDIGAYQDIMSGAIKGTDDFDKAREAKSKITREINEAYPGDNIIKDNLLYRLDPNTNLRPKKRLTDSQLQFISINQKVAANERFKANLSPDYMDERGEIIQGFKRARADTLELTESYAKANRIEEIDLEIATLKTSNIPQSDKNKQIRILEEARYMNWKNVRHFQQKLEFRGIKWNGSSDQMGDILKDNSKNYANAYKAMLAKPGIPFGEYDPKGVEIQKALEKGDIERALELGFDIASWVPITGPIVKAGKAIKWIGRTGATSDVLKSGANARNNAIEQALKADGVDQTNPAEIEKFYMDHPNLGIEAGMESYKQMLGEIVSGKLTGVLAKKMAEGNRVAEKFIEKAVDKAKEAVIKGF